jgi:hypothetical protein
MMPIAMCLGARRLPRVSAGRGDFLKLGIQHFLADCEGLIAALPSNSERLD